MTTYNVTYSNIINHSKKRNHTTNSLAISDEEKSAFLVIITLQIYPSAS